MKTICLFLLSTAIAGIVSAQSRNERKKGDDALPFITEGIAYSLPRTGFRFFIEVEQEKFFHGPYHRYAERYLGIKNAPSSSYENWVITGVDIETYSEPDPDATHRAFGVAASMLNLSDSGTILGINSSKKYGGEPNMFQNPKEDDRFKSREQTNVYTSDFTPNMSVPKEIWTDLSMHSFLERIDTLHFTEYPRKSFEEKAKEVAHNITKLRKRRFLSLASKYKQLPPDGSAYNIMVDELGKIEEESVALFIGKSYKKRHKYVFEVTPASNSDVVFRFSPSTGVLPRSNLSGKPIVLELVTNGTSTKNSKKPSTQKSSNISSSGIFYRTPGNGVVRLLNGNTVIGQARVTIAQFGEVIPVPEKLLDGTYSLEFHPETGALKNINR